MVFRSSSLGAGGAATVPAGGVTGNVQYNNGGFLGGASGVTTDGVNTLNAGFLNVTQAVVPANGIYLAGANILGFASGTTARFSLDNGGAFRASSATGALIQSAAASATLPVLVPNRASSNTGLGAQATGNFSAIVGGVEQERWTANGPILLLQTIVSSLPAAATAGAGARRFVTDALAPVFAAAVAGSGAVFTPVYSDGTIWRCG